MSDKESEKEIHDTFICPVCIDIAYPPYITNCGHLLCEDCFSVMGGLGSKCPKCRKKIEGANPSFEMKTYLEKFVSPEKKSRDFSSYASKTTEPKPIPASTPSTSRPSSSSTSRTQYGSGQGENYVDTIASQLLWNFIKHNEIPPFT